MAALNAIAREYADELRDGIAWVIVWKTGRSWNAQAVWLNSDDDTFEPEDLELARKVLMQDRTAVMLNGYYCGSFGEDMTVADVAAAIRRHYDNSYNRLNESAAFPLEPNQDAPEAVSDNQQGTGTAEPSRPAWMNDWQYEDFRQACALIDTIKTVRDFYRVIDIVSNRFSLDVINAAREYKQCYNSGQYEQPREWAEAVEIEIPAVKVEAAEGETVYTDEPIPKLGATRTAQGGGKDNIMKRQYKETRKITASALRQLCIEQDWYTAGDNDEYGHLVKDDGTAAAGEGPITGEIRQAL